jgi:hypothetical protein
MLNKLLIVMLLPVAIFACFMAAGRRTTASQTPVSQTPASQKAAEAGDHWQIKGALSEACTCNVPCTCNFGEGPSPHSYCYAVYSYEIREGHFNSIKLDGLRFAGTDTAKGHALYLDARAQGDQRGALEAVARKVMRISGDRMGGSKFLGVKNVDIKQQYDDRHDALDIAGAGSFKTDYIMGRDKTKPVVVVNNTEWAVHETIKGKTESFGIKDDYGNQYSASNTNSNHGDFEYDENTVFGSLSCSSSCATGAKGDHGKHHH